MELALCHCLLLGEAGNGGRLCSQAEVMDPGGAERKRHT